MSAEKGGALVRSPPGMVTGGVDTYKPHRASHNAWDLQQSPPGLPIQKQLSARVTKISADGRSTNLSSKNSSSSRKSHRLQGLPSTGASDDEDLLEEPCDCDSWARARQLEHDMDQLRRIHDSILKGLHEQLEEMKQKNRDMTFQLLMGPYANTTTVSPDSENLSQKDNANKNTSAKDDVEDVSKVTSNRRKGKRNNLGDSRQVRSVNLETLEEETKELKRQLVEERTRNKYLLNMTEDLKKQLIKTESWQQPQPQARVLQPPMKQPLPVVKAEDLKLSDHSNKRSIAIGPATSIRLPQILKQDSERRSPQDSQESNQETQKENQSQQHSTRNRGTQKSRKKSNVLPSIGQSSEGTGWTDATLKLEEEESIDYGLATSKDAQLITKGKHKKLNPRDVIGHEFTKNGTEGSMNLQDKKNYHQNRGKHGPSTSGRDSQKNDKNQSPKGTRKSDSLARARSVSKGRLSISSRDSSATGKNIRESQPKNEISAAQDTTTKSFRNESSNKENRPKDGSKSKVVVACKVEDNISFSQHSSSAGTADCSANEVVEALTPTSSSVGKPKHKSRTHRRKNKKKDNHDSRNESKDQ